MNAKEITDAKVESLLRKILNKTLSAQSGVLDVQTFEDAGLLTSNKGLVLRFRDGSGMTEFQVNIVRSR